MVKKVLYGSLLTFAGTESVMIGTKFYELFKNGSMLAIGGTPIVPFWMVVEGSMIIFAPLLTKLIINIRKGGTLADDSELTEMIKQYHKESDNGTK
jgi:hypothetical protein